MGFHDVPSNWVPALLTHSCLYMLTNMPRSEETEDDDDNDIGSSTELGDVKGRPVLPV